MKDNFKNNEERWNHYYELAQNYYLEYGNLYISQKFTSANGEKLGIWIQTQRTRYKEGKLSPEKIAKLESIGMIWKGIYKKMFPLKLNLQASNFEERYHLAKIYFEFYGNLLVKANFKTNDGINYAEDGIPLGNWIVYLRSMYNRLDNNTIKKMEKIGMVWDVHEDKWLTMYNLAQKYFEFYGNLEIPQAFITNNGIDNTKEGEKLGVWILKQRYVYSQNRLDPKRKEMLDEIGMIWNVDEIKWLNNYRLLEEFYQCHHHLNIPTNETKLYRFLVHMRSLYNNGRLSTERIQKLEAIGMVWNIRKEAFEKRNFVLKHGINYSLNKSVLERLTMSEIESKIIFLNQNQMPIINVDGTLNEIFAMSNLDMINKYGVSLEYLIAMKNELKSNNLERSK